MELHDLNVRNVSRKQQKKVRMALCLQGTYSILYIYTKDVSKKGNCMNTSLYNVLLLLVIICSSKYACDKYLKDAKVLEHLNP